MKLVDCINFLLAKSQQNVHQMFKLRLKEFGITPVQYGVLYLLWEKDGLSSTEISTLLKLDNSTITGVIDRMINNYLLTRKNDPKDRRKSLLFLTSKGMELEEPVCNCVEELNKKVLESFTANEKEAFKKMLLTLSK
ncbi:MarR family winged helix-turn-helix transcriptional regulator [Alkalihalobacillus sp. BA299]|uniref:MarR family winged helix-turn-helix transcriptional regulator n=1 Tax=Alkalihalobacillus sp. BA299 TaxID=2815938 RepID=UPI001ADCAA32|nr:MarR family transcriptional regulator [Alkalihalobacillus sp. BA299]